MIRLDTSRRDLLRLLAGTGTLAGLAGLAGCGSDAAATPGRGPGTLTIGMTAADIPNLDTSLTGGQGYEGLRFVGFQLYDGLTRYDLDQDQEIPGVVPALATSWESDDSLQQWTFHLREGVLFTDGTPFDADAVVFNLDRYLKADSPDYAAAVAAQASLSLAGVKEYRAVDEKTLAITTNGPWSHLAADLTTIFMASPTAVRGLGEGFALAPVGTGPFVVENLVRGQELVLRPNENYWGGAPALERLVLVPVSDVSTREAALRSGEVDWIEAPNPDDIDWLTSRGFQVLTNSYDHVWPWVLDTANGPLADVRVRRAMNLAIDRETLAGVLLHNTADPAYQTAPRASLSYRAENDVFSHDPDEARRLLTEAGHPDGVDLVVVYPTSGSGNMQPAAMNQALSSDLAKVGIRVTLKPLEWSTLLSQYVTGAIPEGADAVNISLTFLQETSWNLYFGSASPVNVGKYANPDVDALFGEALGVADPQARADVYARATALIDADAPWMVVVNDRNPRALSPRVHGFVQPKSWFADLDHTTTT